jgi:DNA-binding transcriptional LysR family regulator
MICSIYLFAYDRHKLYHYQDWLAMLNLHKLEVFALVAQEGSFSHAAERLYMTQAAVSQHMRELEATLGTPLFVRGRRGVDLTPSGERLAEYAKRIFALVAEAELAVTDVSNLSKGQLTLGASAGVSVYLLPDWAQPFSMRYPQLTLSVMTHTTPKVIEALLAHQVELGIVEDSPDETENERLGLVTLQEVDQFVIVGRKHAWWGRDQLAINDLNGQLLVARQQGSHARIWLDKTFTTHDIHPRISAEFDAPESVKRAVMAGISFTILPDYAVNDEVEMGMLYRIPLTGRPLMRVLNLIWDKSTPITPMARAFVVYLSGRFPHAMRAVQPT